MNEDLATIGRQVKAMFPQSGMAQGMSDAEVGQLWQRKYGKTASTGGS